MIAYQPDYDYTLEEFIEHFDYFVRVVGHSNRQMIIRYFASRYPDRQEGRYKCNRYMRAFTYVVTHGEEFEEHAVRGEKRLLVRQPLLVAVWWYFRAIPDEQLQADPPSELIRQMAREAQA